MTTPEIILGPPGTGKTTTLLNIVDAELAQGTQPDKIGYVSFTRRAVEEARDRACERFSIKRDDLPFFNTLHSICFHQFSIGRNAVFTMDKLKKFGAEIGTPISGRWSVDGTFSGYDKGDRLLFMENLARVRCITLEQQYNLDNDGFAWLNVSRFRDALTIYKREHGLWDYTDMIEEYVRSGTPPALEVLIVDEDQDISQIQWRMITKLATHVRRFVVAGDDDQAIYRWSGADVDHLLTMPGTKTVLSQSYRVPPLIQQQAGVMIPHMGNRLEKVWAPRTGSEGIVEHIRDPAEAAEGIEGEALVLVRNNYILREYVEPVLRRAGRLWETDGVKSISTKLTKAIMDWERLRRGEELSTGEVKTIYEYISTGERLARGAKTKLENMDADDQFYMVDLRRDLGLLADGPWFDVLDRLPEDDVNYIRAVLARGVSLRDKPKIRLSTIHGAKGTEADHVLLYTEMAKSTYNEMRAARQDEARVWYVAVTRARERLTIVGANTPRVCPWL